jgi:hypothetical protein
MRRFTAENLFSHIFAESTDTTIFLLRVILSLQCCSDNTAYMNGASSRAGAAL